MSNTKITVVSYCHEAHKSWIPFWAEQLSKQTFRDFNVLFIAHNWGEQSTNQVIENFRMVMAITSKHLDQDLRKRLRVRSYWSPPVIGDVIDFGCRRIETEFFAHWDVDDIIHPERLRLQSEFLDAHPETDFLGTRMVGFYGEPKPEMLQLDYAQPDEPNLEVTDHDDIYRVLLRRNQNCLGHTTMIYRPGVLQDLGGFSRSDVKLDGKSPDFETWKKALMAGYRFHRLPQLCALWRLDSSSIRS
jgi:hypothetical protein